MIYCAIIAFFLCFVFIFYISRHSWATIAANDLKIDKYVVHSALNHVDESMRVTEIYIKKDFSAINEANSKVIDYVFNNNVY